MPMADIDYEDVFYEDRMSVDWHEEQSDYPDQHVDSRDEWLTEIWRSVTGGDYE